MLRRRYATYAATKRLTVQLGVIADVARLEESGVSGVGRCDNAYGNDLQLPMQFSKSFATERLTSHFPDEESYPPSVEHIRLRLSLLHLRFVNARST